MKKTIKQHFRDQGGFTLVELLTVIVIIAVLSALLLGSIGAAFRFAKRTKAHTEIKNLEIAINKFYTEYRRWPDTTPNLPNETVRVDGDIARMLAGDGIRGNTKRFQFMSFQSLNSANNPVNPWARPGSPSDNDYYYFKLDHNFDNVIDGTGDPAEPPQNTVRRSVIVWTWNSDRQELMGSWDD